jgi:quinol monooxygenase YgiN
MAGSVHIPWYATGFRGDGLEQALSEIAQVSQRYGATSYAVYRYRDDRYKFLQVATFESKLDWERYWGGPEFERFRALHSGWYQVPVIYTWADVAIEGSLPGNGMPHELHGSPAGGDTV